MSIPMIEDATRKAAAAEASKKLRDLYHIQEVDQNLALTKPAGADRGVFYETLVQQAELELKIKTLTRQLKEREADLEFQAMNGTGTVDAKKAAAKKAIKEDPEIQRLNKEIDDAEFQKNLAHAEYKQASKTHEANIARALQNAAVIGALGAN